MCFFIYRLIPKFKLLNLTLRRAERFGPVRATSRSLNQLHADPNNGSAMCIYVPNGESLNAMHISAHRRVILTSCLLRSILIHIGVYVSLHLTST